jgi:hypothetical protein
VGEGPPTSGTPSASRALAPLIDSTAGDPDIALAQRLAERKGLPYQTYIKSLLHEALERERVLAERQ